MKERPILFSAPMVRALLAGTKTQTRRVLKMPTGFDFTGGSGDDHDNPVNWGGEDENGMWWALTTGADIDHALPCPYGQAGDRLWVKETWRPVEVSGAMMKVHYPHTGSELLFSREQIPYDWRVPRAAVRSNVSPLFMPRWASRVTLEITGVRVERLQAISEDDAKAEGIEPNWIGPLDTGPNGSGSEGWLGDTWIRYGEGVDGEPAYSPVESFRSLWQSINGPTSWDTNPWVWVVEFKRLPA